MSLLPIADALDRLRALALPLPIVEMPLADAAGRLLAEDRSALRTQPAADLSAMDGYAIRFAEAPGPWRVIGESAAGSPPGQVIAAGEAMRIFTGAPLPAGADCVLVQEDASRDGATVRMVGEGPPGPGAHVRRAGSEFTAGAPLLAAGDRLTAARIALAAVAGHGSLPVRRRPRIAIVSTGDELVPPGAPVGPGQLPSSNAAMLAAMLAAWPVDIDDLGIVADDRTALRRTFEAAARSADILVTIGGASVGDHDLVRPALADTGAALDFWRVAIKPGKPLMAGRLGDAVLLGLPGNPVSAFVTATLFLLPLVAALIDDAALLPGWRTLPLARALPATGGRAEYLRARIVDGRAVPVGDQGSAGVIALAAADLLIVRPPFAAPALPGDSAETLIIA
ncbi:gephyrin-like molybdotransferase Glp [Sphingomonas sp. 1P06PA]|uniref:molybdopterin molybdotransferase MoeA n=1 Tax=Sphingomonas sp. 1P06PA TaxID=554121 RepID=UPI0039A4E8EF